MVIRQTQTLNYQVIIIFHTLKLALQVLSRLLCERKR